MNNVKSDNNMILSLNALGVVAAYILLGFSLYLSVDVPLSTKGFWGMGIVLLTLSLINVVKYRFDAQVYSDRIRQLEEAKNEKLLEEFVSDATVE